MQSNISAGEEDQSALEQRCTLWPIIYIHAKPGWWFFRVLRTWEHGSKICGKKMSIIYWQSALYKISCSIYIYLFKYLYRNVVWNIKTNQFNIIDCVWSLVGKCWGVDRHQANSSGSLYMHDLLSALLSFCMTFLCCFAFVWHSVAQFTKHLN